VIISGSDNKKSPTVAVRSRLRTIARKRGGDGVLGLMTFTGSIVPEGRSAFPLPSVPFFSAPDEHVVSPKVKCYGSSHDNE